MDIYSINLNMHILTSPINKRQRQNIGIVHISLFAASAFVVQLSTAATALISWKHVLCRQETGFKNMTQITRTVL